MKVTIAIPAYNEEAWISRTLRAAVREASTSGIDTEILVVDNASTDRTVEVVSQFPSVRVVREPVKGLAAARNRAYREARGELVVNIDADVLLPHGYLQAVVRAFDRSPRLVLLSGPYHYYDMPQLTSILVKVWYVLGVLWGEIAQHLLRIGAVTQGGNYAVRRSAMERVGGCDASIDFYGEDVDLACRMARIGLVRFDFRLQVRTSGRRMIQEGVFMTGYRYALNTFFVMFYGRPFDRTHKDVRSVQGRARRGPRRPKMA